MNISEKNILEALKLIQTLEPYPAREFDTTTIKYIVPELFIFKENDKWQVKTNETFILPLKINKKYSKILKENNFNKDKDYDVVDSIMNQVYLDEDYLKEAWGNNYVVNINKLRSAVNETIDECLTYDDKVIDALFFSTSNGYTEDADLVFNLNLPYLKSVESKWDEKESSAFSTTTVIPLNKFYEKLNLKYNKELKVEIIKRSPTNRVLELKINNQKFTGKDLYNSLSLRSTDFIIF